MSLQVKRSWVTTEVPGGEIHPLKHRLEPTGNRRGDEIEVHVFTRFGFRVQGTEWFRSDQLEPAGPVSTGVRGICSYCQEAHPLEHNPDDRCEEEGGIPDVIGQFVMAPHLVFGDSGPQCEGEGSIPETVFVED